MKNIYKIFASLFLIVGAYSCDNADDIVYEVTQAEENFTINAPAGGSTIVLDDTNVNNTALTLVWDDTANGSDVTYNVEFAIRDTEFAAPIIGGTTESGIVNLSWTVAELNGILLNQLRVPHSESALIETRVVASNNSISNTITLVLTPHVVEVTELYVNSSATGWDPTQAIAMTMTDVNIFNTVIELVDGEEFNFIESNTNDDVVWQLVEAGLNDLTKFGGSNISGLGAGKFDITVDLIANTVSYEQILTPDELFLVGSLTGWDPATSLPFDKNGDIFTITIDLPDGAEFKFLPQNTGWDGDWGEDPNNPGSIIQDGEQNVSGYAAGKYKITVDFSTLTFNLEAVVAPDELFLVGSLTGWDPATSWPFALTSENVFTIVADLPDGAEFKFLPQNTGWENDFGEDPSNAGSIISEGEQNVGGYAAGKYIITVDFNTQTYSLASADNLYLVGSLTGWDPATSIQMGEASLGIFSTIIDLPDGAEFKFLPQNTGWDGDWGEDPSNTGRVISDGEQNLAGYAAGKYVIAVDFNTLSFTVSAVTDIPATLYLVGGFNGWSNDAGNPQFTETSTGVFEITQTLTAGDEFKFVPVAGDWGNDWGESTVSSGVLEQNTEQNVSVDASGDYTIIVDFNNGTVSASL